MAEHLETSESVPTFPRSTWTFERTLKEPAVEEPVNYWWHRRVAFQVVRLFEHTPAISPNHITVLALLTGLAAAWAAYRSVEHGPLWCVVGAFLIFASVIFDCADGMLARLRGGGSQFGMLLDGFVDLVVGVAVWYAVSYTTTERIDAWWDWPLAFLVLVSIVVHCALYDHLKNRFMRHVAPEAPMVQAVTTKVDPRQASWAHRFLDSIYRNVYGTIAGALSGSNKTPETIADPETYRRELSVPMRMVSWIGLGSHLFVMYLATLGGAAWPVLPFLVANVVINLGMNGLMVAALVAWKRGEARARQRARSG